MSAQTRGRKRVQRGSGPLVKTTESRESMTITTSTQVSDLIDRKALDPTGDNIGTVSTVYVDDVTNEPTWLAITTGWFGTRVSFAPVAGAYLADDDVVVAYPKDTVKDAPNIDADGTLTPDEAFALYAYYGISTKPTSDRTDDVDSAGARDRGTDDAMTRSEEELDVSTRRQEAGRVRLRKWVETEDVHMTVPIRREKARLVTEPITDANRDAALSGPDISEAEHEVVLSEEVIEVNKRVVPKERVRVETEVDTEEVPIDESVRKERIEMDHEDRSTRRRGRPVEDREGNV
jgi:uncharacterized protein (TIGR02271 family)